MFVHRKIDFYSPVGFSGGDVPLGDDGEGLGGGAEAAGLEAGDEGPDGAEVAEAGGEVNGEVEGGGVVGVVGVVLEGVEEEEGFGTVVPEALEDAVDQGWGPVESGVVEGFG